ncbi:MAG: DUF2283 domain-containing protein [Nanoarchaeota archaeon]
MAKIISYDKENDILVIHNGFSANEKFKGNIDAGDLILDISTEGRVRGIEVLNAMSFFKEFEIGRKALENLLEAKFNAVVKPTSIVIAIMIKGKDMQEMPAKIAVPIEVPVRRKSAKGL